MEKRKVALVTGSRCSYGIYTPVLEAIEKHPDLDYKLIVTGMHLSKIHGYTIQEIRNDGWRIDCITDMLLNNDDRSGQVNSLFIGGMGFTQAFVNNRPDILLAQGDRGETLAAVIAAAHLNIPVAHMHGGEVSGTIDESNRHAITKFSHIHFPATRKSEERIKSLGEEEWRIHLTGAAGLDHIGKIKLLEPEIISEKYNINIKEPVLLVLQHPCTSDVATSRDEMETTLAAIKELNFQTIIIYPNADAGSMGIISAINDFINSESTLIDSEKLNVAAYRNIDHLEYLSLMNICSVMIGNSSGAIIEAPSFGLPVVNIGTRQNSREKARNVLDVRYDKNEIKNAIIKSLEDEEFKAAVQKRESPYDPFGTKNAGERIAEVLSDVEITGELLVKRITY